LTLDAIVAVSVTHFLLSNLIMHHQLLFLGALFALSVNALSSIDLRLNDDGRASVSAPYDNIAQALIKESMTNCNTSKLEYMCDTFGPRLAGMSSLEHAIDYILQTMKEEVSHFVKQLHQQ
jgi:hypothetical protein